MFGHIVKKKYLCIVKHKNVITMSYMNVSIERMVSFCNHQSEGKKSVMYTLLEDEYTNLKCSARNLLAAASAGLINLSDLESTYAEYDALLEAAAHVKVLRDIAKNSIKKDEEEKTSHEKMLQDIEARIGYK